ncbi:MAG: hypothetical protein QF745_09525, partial [Planctomycetota bacterium]|nr:hypothetical protein [Planctomycetota bacterium]
FQADEILESAAACAESFALLGTCRGTLPDFSLPPETGISDLDKLHKTIRSLGDQEKRADGELIKRLASQLNIDRIKEFLLTVEKVREFRASMVNMFVQPLNPNLPEQVQELGQIMEKFDLGSIVQSDLNMVMDDRKREISALSETVCFFQQVEEAFEGVNEITTSTVVAACDLVDRISREILALRSDVLVDPAAKAVFKKGHKKATDLRTRRESLNSRMSLGSLPEKVEIEVHAANMAAAGFFSFLSSDYRQAKNFYLSISRNKKFTKSSAVNDLQELTEWVSEVDSFSSERQLKRLMGLQFNGLDTDFQPFADVLEFYAQIDASLGGPGNSKIREFLRNASVDTLISLPKVAADHSVRSFQNLTLEDLGQRLTKAKKFVASFKTPLKRLEELAGSLRQREGVTSDRLISLEAELRLFQGQWNDAQEDEAVEEILGAKFKGAETRKEDVSSELVVASAVVELGQVMGEALLRSIQTRTVPQIYKVVGDIIQADRKADEQLKELASLSKMEEKSLRGILVHNELVEKFKLAASDKEGLLAHSRLTSA